MQKSARGMLSAMALSTTFALSADAAISSPPAPLAEIGVIKPGLFAVRSNHWNEVSSTAVALVNADPLSYAVKIFFPTLEKDKETRAVRFNCETIIETHPVLANAYSRKVWSLPKQSNITPEQDARIRLNAVFATRTALDIGLAICEALPPRIPQPEMPPDGFMKTPYFIPDRHAPRRPWVI